MQHLPTLITHRSRHGNISMTRSPICITNRATLQHFITCFFLNSESQITLSSLLALLRHSLHLKSKIAPCLLPTCRAYLPTHPSSLTSTHPNQGSPSNNTAAAPTAAAILPVPTRALPTIPFPRSLDRHRVWDPLRHLHLMCLLPENSPTFRNA